MSPAQPRRFMVVDDSRAILAIIRRVIQESGYPSVDVRTVGNGEEALALLPQFEPDLLITDWHMPRVSGLELLQTLRQLGRTQMKVGFVTTESSPSLLEQARTNGAAFVVRKPFRDRELIDQIHAHVPPPAGVRPTGTPAQSDAQEPAEYPLRRDHCQGLIEHTLGHQPFTLNSRTPIRQVELDGTVLLGLYSAPGKPAAAVGVFDAGALCLLGGGALRLTPVRIASALANGGPTADMITQATTLMRAAGMMLQSGGSEEGCSLARTMSVQPEFKKLEEVLARPDGRCDFQLLMPDIGSGLMSFIAL